MVTTKDCVKLVKTWTSKVVAILRAVYDDYGCHNRSSASGIAMVLFKTHKMLNLYIFLFAPSVRIGGHLLCQLLVDLGWVSDHGALAISFRILCYTCQCQLYAVISYIMQSIYAVDNFRFLRCQLLDIASARAWHLQ